MPEDQTNETKYIYYGGAVKSLGGDLVGGYLVPFTDSSERDVFGEYFTADTDFVISAFPIKGYNTLYQHGMDEDLAVIPIGDFCEVEFHDKGIWAVTRKGFVRHYRNYLEGLKKPGDWKAQQLKLAEEYQTYLDELTHKSKLGYSSGALPTSVVVDEDGKILRWAIVEGSWTPTPAKPNSTRIQSIKSLPVASLRELKAREASERADTTGDEQHATDAAPPQPIVVTTEKQRSKAMNPDEIRARLAELFEEIVALVAGGAGDGAPMNISEDEAKMAEDDVTAAVEEEEEKSGKSLTEADVTAIIERVVSGVVEGKVKAVQARKALALAILTSAVQLHGKGESKVKGYSNPDMQRETPQISVGDNLKYAHLSASDLAMGYKLAIAATPLGARGLAGHVPTDFVTEEYYKYALHAAYAYHDKSPLERPQEELALKSARPFKMQELDASNITGQGVEYLGYFYDSVVWEVARNQRIYELMQSRGMLEKEVPQGAKSTYVPVEGTDPTVYGGGEANSTDSTGRPEVVYKITPITTIQQTVTPGTFRAATANTLILQEDSIVDIASEANRKLTLALQENIEKAFLNADTETAASTNINNADGTPTATGLTADYFLQFNGLIKSPLVTSTAFRRDAAGTLSLNDYLNTLSLLPPEQAARADNLFYVIDFYVRQASLKFPELKTREVAEGDATVFTGALPALWGIPVYMSGFLSKANTSGKVAVTTPANNTTGRIVLVYAPYWAFTYKRNLTIETERIPESETTAFYGAMRFSLTRRSASAAAISFNVGV